MALSLRNEPSEMSIEAVANDQLIEALIGVAKVCATGSSTVKDDLSLAILILVELVACISTANVEMSESRIEQRARRLAEIENSLVDLEPRECATITRQRLGLSKSSYYRNRAVAKQMRIL
jgi:hypothetical protein